MRRRDGRPAARSSSAVDDVICVRRFRTVAPTPQLAVALAVAVAWWGMKGAGRRAATQVKL